MKKAIAIAAAVTALGASAGTANAGGFKPYYIDELKMSNTLESRGIYDANYKHVNVNLASCTGLRRYGVRSNAYGLDRFWHFDCDVQSASGHFYDVHVKTISKPGSHYWNWRFVSVRFEF